MARHYKTFLLSEEPKLAGIPITTAIPVFLLTTIGLFAGYAFELFIIGAVLSLVMHYRFGGFPLRFFLASLYWGLPHRMSSLLFRAFPDSSNRLYTR
ncbi:TPA: type IV conjugative transfer system protein TraL [Legionella feeleii]